MKDNLEGLTIKKQEQEGSTLKLTLSNGKVISIFRNEFSYTNENTFNFEEFHGKQLNENIFDFLESSFFSLADINCDMHTKLEKEDLLSAKIIIDKNEELIQVYLEFPLETLKGKTVDWDEDWYENKDEVIRNLENVQEIYFLDLNNDKPNTLYNFLDRIVSK